MNEFPVLSNENAKKMEALRAEVEDSQRKKQKSKYYSRQRNKKT